MRSDGSPAPQQRWTAVVFDFDGLILDTETPLYDAWRVTFEHHGVEPIPLEEDRKSVV